MLKRPFYQHDKWSDIIAHFTPNWFGMTMGTGIVAICFNTLMVLFHQAKIIACTLWILNILLFTIFALAFVLRGACYPQSWHRMLKHPIQPMFLGCIPMGLATIINGFIIFGIDLFGNGVISIAVNLWWIDVILSLLSILVVPYFMFKHHEHSLNSMTAVWLLPFVACEVAAASGALMLPHLDPDIAATITIASLILWFASVTLALSILVIFFQRLALHKLPSSDLASSVFLQLGPTGTGALAIVLLAANIHYVPTAGVSSQFVNMLAILPGLGLFVGIAMWTLGTWWLIIALVATVQYIRNKSLKFNLGFWAYTFPVGVYTMATVNLAKLLESSVIYWYSVLLVLALSITWIVVFIKTIKGAYSGGLIKDPAIV